jgi:hypothetical protein
LSVILALAGCGEADENNRTRDAGGGASDGSGECLSAAQVDARINEIASGFEGSDAEVARKQRKIRSVRAHECP